MKTSTRILIVVFSVLPLMMQAQSKILVLQSDFGLKDGAVAAMKGVALNVSRDLSIYDLTHEIPAFNIWEASYRLNQTASYWPVGTVFVSIVDPGVGSSRKSVVMKSKKGSYYFVTPDNGTLTHIAESMGVEEVRVIDESKNRLPGSGESYTFHGRDVYAYTGARLASGVIKFSEVGPPLKDELIKISYEKASISNGELKGTVDVLDVQYGNVWTNIPKTLLDKQGLKYGDRILLRIYYNNELKYESDILYAETFSAVAEGMPVAYVNSLLNFSVGLNMGNFASKFSIGSGAPWHVVVKKI